MKTRVFFTNIRCSEEFQQGLDNEILTLSVINILLGISAIVGNIVILIALHKETSLNQAFKVLLRYLVASDLCVGFVQITKGVRGILFLQGQWQICRLLYLAFKCINLSNKVQSLPISLSLYHQIYEFLKGTFKNLLNYHLLCFVPLARAISSHVAYCHINSN